MMMVVKIFILPAAALLLAAAGRPPAPHPEYRPVTPAPAPAPLANGGIFQAAAGYSPLTMGQRAGSIGDVLTVVLTERTTAQKSATLATERGGSIGLTPPSTGPLSFFNPSDIAMGGNSESAGRGSTQQTNALFGEITVTVADTYSNGTMLVRGEKRVRINRGDEFIRVSGIVRQSDIGPDNRIPSTRIADARIDYVGTGEVARAARQGWLQRFFSIISPF